jgi:hypothetical protein
MVKVGILSRNFTAVSRKYETNALAAAPGLLYQNGNAANQKWLVLAGALVSAGSFSAG